MHFQTIDKRSIEEVIRTEPVNATSLIAIAKRLSYQRRGNAHGPGKTESTGELRTVCFTDADRELTEAFIEAQSAIDR
jgi:hypothetical protein